MKIKGLLTTMALFLVATAVQAVPAKPGAKKTIRQADGTTIELTLRGDEHFAFYTDASGAAFKLQPGDKLQPMSAEQVSETWTKARQARKIDRRARTRGIGDRPTANTGKHRGLVILMQFKDQKFVTPEPQQTFHRFFNEVGYNENGMTGSVKDYFLAQSYGQLDIDFDVVGPYTAADSMAYYGSHAIIDDREENDAHPAEFIAQAVDSAAAEVDYSNYDWDGDGIVDQVFVIFAGYAEAQGASPETIWPHEWTLETLPKEYIYNGVRITTYGCAAELKGDGVTNTDIMDGIGTACHEFSHCLGLPDMYDTENSVNYGMGYWDVMDAGSYLDDSCTPSGYTSYERWFCGWLEPTELKGDMTQIVGMKPLAESPECYVLYNEGNKNEYYLLENRQNVGFDAALFGHGLLVLHVDYDRDTWENNLINVDPEHQRLTIIPADGEYGLYSYKSLAGDPYPGFTENTALANYSTPASTVYNANSDGKYFMNKSIDSITESEDGLISFVALRPEFEAPASTEATEVAGESSFTITWSAVKDAAGYQVELNEPYVISPVDALQCEYDFAKTQSESVESTDISSNLADYDLDGWAGKNLFTTPNKLLIGTSEEVGEIRTKAWQVPSSKNITVVFDAAPVDKTPVRGAIYLLHYNKGDKQAHGSGQLLNVTDDGYYMFTFPDVDYDYFYVYFKPDAQMYLNYFATLDGIWTKDEMGYGEGSTAGKHCKNITIYDTDTNSITLTDLNTDSQYLYRVRAKSAEGFYSSWTDEQSFQFTSSGISSMLTAPHRTGKIYDLQGRPRGTNLSALPKGIYIIGGKKVVK